MRYYKLLLFLVTLPTLALDILDSLDSKISDFNSEVIIINSGIPDGIQQGNIFRLYESDEPKARALVVRVNETHAALKLFYNFDKWQPKKDVAIKLTKMGTNFEVDEKDASLLDSKKLLEKIPKPNTKNNYVPFEPFQSQMDAADPAQISFAAPIDSNLSDKKNDENKEFLEYFKKFSGSINIANTLSNTSDVAGGMKSSAKDITYRFSMESQESDPYTFRISEISYNSKETKRQNFDKTVTTEEASSKKMSVGFDIDNFWAGRVGYFSELTYTSSMVNKIYDPLVRVDGKPMGFSWKVIPKPPREYSGPRKKLNLSWAPLLSYNKRQVKESLTDPVTYETTEQIVVQSKLDMKFSFRINASFPISDRNTFAFQFDWDPNFELYEKNLDPKNATSKATISFLVPIAEYLEPSLNLSWEQRRTNTLETNYTDKSKYYKYNIQINRSIAINFAFPIQLNF